MEHNIITSQDEFYDINISVLSHKCPYCATQVSADLVQKFLDGESIKCKYCGSIFRN